MQGGAIYSQQGLLTIRDSNFTSNIAVVDGGAVFISSDGAAATNISATKFSNNKALKGAGGAVLLAASKLEAAVQGCRFENNQAATAGGALSVQQLVPNAPGNLEMGCVDTGLPEGGICTSKDTPTQNMQCFASINASNGSVFREYKHASQPVVIESTGFFGNRATSKQSGIGGALHLVNINAKVSGCGLANNFAAVDGGAVYLGGSGSLIGLAWGHYLLEQQHCRWHRQCHPFEQQGQHHIGRRHLGRHFWRGQWHCGDFWGQLHHRS